jgi:hypothetical protein
MSTKNVKETGNEALVEMLSEIYSTETNMAAPSTPTAVTRWIAGRRAGNPEFDPLYTSQKA